MQTFLAEEAAKKMPLLNTSHRNQLSDFKSTAVHVIDQVFTAVYTTTYRLKFDDPNSTPATRGCSISHSAALRIRFVPVANAFLDKIYTKFL